MINKKLQISFITLCLILCWVNISQAQSVPKSHERAIAAKEDGDYNKAEKILSQLIKESPNNAQLWFQLGLNQRFQGKLKESMQSQLRATKLEPNNSDIKLEIARLHYWNKDLKPARKLIDPIVAKYPNYKEAVELQSAIIKSQKTLTKNPYRWQLDLGYEHSEFERREQKDWHLYSTRLNYHLNDDTLIYGAFEDADRFDTHDQFYEIGTYHHFNRKYNAGFAVGYTPDASFFPEWRLRGEGQAEIIEKGNYIGNSWLTAKIDYNRYRSSDEITVVKPGIRYYIIDTLSIHPEMINVFDENNRHLRGWAVRLDWQTNFKPLRLFVGLADAPENQNGVTVDTKSHFIGMAYQINKRLTWHLSYNRDDRENSFIRKVVATALSIKF
ncbi:MAG: YaiO family outer membrane beta-barrel protein [Proteobacteria bacterium]|nr:YaiO family outer membrane beta-barrel protein [Pseudomonadota bacterium]